MSSENKWTESDVRAVLEARYRPPEYSFFAGVSSHTGTSSARTRYADAVAIGLWSADPDVYCFEIKVSRSDFKTDVVNFTAKQGFHFRNCNKFYYVAPCGVIDKDELPEGCGLMEVQAGGRLVTVKLAVHRKMDGMDLSFVQSLSRHVLRQAGAFEKPHAHAIKFLGKETDAKDVDAYIEKEIAKRFKDKKEWQIDAEVRRKVHDILEKSGEYTEVRSILKEMGMTLLGYNDPVAAVRRLKSFERIYSWVIENRGSLKDFMDIINSIKMPEDGNGGLSSYE